MTAHNWTYLFADLATNRNIAEVPLTGPQITKALNASGTLNGTTVPITDPRLKNLNMYDLTTPCRRVVYAIRDAEPVFGGIIWTRSYDSDSQVVTIGCSDWWSYFNHRKLLPPFVYPPPDQYYIADPSNATTFTNTEQNAIARALVAQAQAHTGGNIGVLLDNTFSFVGRDRTYWGYELGDVGARLLELCNLDGGPDIVFDVSGYDTSGHVNRIMRVGTPMIGQQGSPHVWETGGNIIKYTWPSDGTKMATRMFTVGSGFDVTTSIAVVEDSVKYTNGWALFDGETSYSTVEDYTILQSHATSDQRNARLPIVLPVLNVRGDVSPRIGEYQVGDDARVVVNDNWLKADVRMRIIQTAITPGEDIENVTVTMAPLTEEVV